MAKRLSGDHKLFERYAKYALSVQQDVVERLEALHLDCEFRARPAAKSFDRFQQKVDKDAFKAVSDLAAIRCVSSDPAALPAIHAAIKEAFTGSVAKDAGAYPDELSYRAFLLVGNDRASEFDLHSSLRKVFVEVQTAHPLAIAIFQITTNARGTEEDGALFEPIEHEGGKTSVYDAVSAYVRGGRNEEGLRHVQY